MSMPKFMLSLLIWRLDAKGSDATGAAPLLMNGFVLPGSGCEALRGCSVAEGTDEAGCVYTAWCSGIVGACVGMFCPGDIRFGGDWYD